MIADDRQTCLWMIYCFLCDLFDTLVVLVRLDSHSDGPTIAVSIAGAITITDKYSLISGSDNGDPNRPDLTRTDLSKRSNNEPHD